MLQIKSQNVKMIFYVKKRPLIKKTLVTDMINWSACSIGCIISYRRRSLWIVA